MSSNAHEKLVDVVSKSPNREWIEDFFEYADELLSYEEIDHHEGDDRLVISVQSDRIAITMNSRYVLVAFFNEERTGFIVRERSGQIDDLVESSEGYYSFKTLQNEEDKPPELVELSDAAEYLEDDSIRQNWLTASSIEFDRWVRQPTEVLPSTRRSTNFGHPQTQLRGSWNTRIYVSKHSKTNRWTAVLPG